MGAWRIRRIKRLCLEECNEVGGRSLFMCVFRSHGSNGPIETQYDRSSWIGASLQYGGVDATLRFSKTCGSPFQP